MNKSKVQVLSKKALCQFMCMEYRGEIILVYNKYLVAKLKDVKFLLLENVTSAYIL